MLSRQNLPMPLLRVVLQFLSLAVSVMDILVMSQDEASARRTKRARAHYHERASLHCCKGRAYRDVAFAAGGIALGGKGPVGHAGPICENHFSPIQPRNNLAFILFRAG